MCSSRRSYRATMTSTISEGGGRMILLILSRRTAPSHTASSSAVIASGQYVCSRNARSLASMTGLDRFTQMSDVEIEAFLLHHPDMPRTRQFNAHLVDDRRGAPPHNQHSVRQKNSLANAVRNK